MNQENEENKTVESNQYKSLWDVPPVVEQPKVIDVVPTIEPVIEPYSTKEEPTTTEPVNSSSDTTSLEDDKKKNKKSKLHNILLIILFIFILVFVWFLPDINTYVKLMMDGQMNDMLEEEKNQDKEDDGTEEVVEPTATPAENLSKVCTLSTIATNNLPNTTTITLYYTDTKVNKVKKELVETFASQDENYTTSLSACKLIATNFDGTSGFTQTCSGGDLTVATASTYDLTTFVTTTKTINGVNKVVSINIENGALLETVTANLTQQGYTCN